MPRCVAAVHHGGAGTTAASVGAGIPTVVCSVFADQPFWGARVEDAGVGAHLRFRDLDRRPARAGRPRTRSTPRCASAPRRSPAGWSPGRPWLRAAADAVEARVA